MKSRFAAVAVVAAASLLAAPAWSASSSSASIGPLSITLFDLNPGDGITPSITFSQGAGLGSVAEAFVEYASGASAGNAQVGSGPWASVMADVPMGSVYAAAQVAQAGPAGNGALLSAAGAASNVAGPLGLFQSYAARAYVPESLDLSATFTLSANTFAIFSAPSTVIAQAQGVSALNCGCLSDYAYANVSFDVFGPGLNGAGSQSSWDYLEIAVSSYLPGDTQSDSQSRSLSVSFANSTSGDLSGVFAAYVSVDGQAFANPVPEPETYALMLGGLGVVALAAARRRRRRVS